MDFIELIFLSPVNSILFFLLIFVLNVIGVFIYKKIAINYQIFAHPNFRTLHEVSVPRGGGIVFSCIFVIGVLFLWCNNLLSKELFLILGVGGGLASIFGFVDDIYNIKASYKLLIQICLSSWIVFWLEGHVYIKHLEFLNEIINPLLIFFLVWMINAYNFMDGIDGMAVSGAFYITGTLTLILLIVNGSPELILMFILLMASVGGFMLFNWPPASIFMGDSGSVFLGYLFGSFILVTIVRDELTLWTWLVIFGYFFADTSVTQIARIILVKEYFKPHRSHAYQNLARILGSHFKVTSGVTMYHLMWLLPLSLWTISQPDMQIFATFLAIFPGFIIAYKYGPIFSSS